MRKIFYILSLLVVLTASTVARAEMTYHSGHQMPQNRESTMPASSGANMSMMDMGKDMGSCCCKKMCGSDKMMSEKMPCMSGDGASKCGCCKGMTKGKCKMPERTKRPSYQFNN